jgi:diacylglycerol kinase (ATP)
VAEEPPQDERRQKPRVETVPYTSPFTFMGRVRSFRHAIMGLWFVLRSQHNAWLHAVATVLAIVLGVAVHLSADEWCLLALAMVTVWVSEAFNTGLEVLADAVVSERHPVVKIAKDVAAAAVLLSALGAIVVGCLLFIPHLIELASKLGAAR